MPWPSSDGLFGEMPPMRSDRSIRGNGLGALIGPQWESADANRVPPAATIVNGYCPRCAGLRARTPLLDPLGCARSHGCIWLANDAIDWLVATVGEDQLPGTPVQVS